MYRATYFQNKCKFWDKEVTYIKRKSEFLKKYAVEQAKRKMLQYAKKKNDFHLIVLASINDLTAAEVQYHSSRYTYYTCPVTGKKVTQKSDYQMLELENFKKLLNLAII